MATLQKYRNKARLKSGYRYRLPEIPEREPDDMTSFQHLAETGSVHFLIHRLGNRESTIVSGERYLCQAPRRPMRYPDLLVSFNANRQLYLESNGYIISEQGKPPDFVLEIASPRTGRVDTQIKPEFYSGLGITEYWRFDETGAFHRARLAGDRLGAECYESIPIEALAEGILQGYSSVLNLYIRWEHGELRWHDPDTGEHIPTFENQMAQAQQEQLRAQQERLRADREQAQAQRERLRADREQAQAQQEREARLAAEARIRALEAELANLDRDIQ